MSLADSYIKKELTPAQAKIGRDEEMKKAFLEESGLEGASVEYLRKQFLSSEEAAAAKAEELEDIRIRKSRKADWDEYVDAKRRWGRALHHSDLIPKFHRLIPNLVVDLSPRYDDILSLYTWDRFQKFGSKTGGTVFLAWMHMGWNPEYEIDLVNDVGIAVKQMRGWRTLIVRFICRREPETFLPKSLFTEDQAMEEFGYPTQGATASKYREHLWKFRNQTPEAARSQWLTMEAMQRHRYA